MDWNVGCWIWGIRSDALCCPTSAAPDACEAVSRAPCLAFSPIGPTQLVLAAMVDGLGHIEMNLIRNFPRQKSMRHGGGCHRERRTLTAYGIVFMLRCFSWGVPSWLYQSFLASRSASPRSLIAYLVPYPWRKRTPTAGQYPDPFRS